MYIYVYTRLLAAQPVDALVGEPVARVHLGRLVVAACRAPERRRAGVPP